MKDYIVYNSLYIKVQKQAELMFVVRTRNSGGPGQEGWREHKGVLCAAMLQFLHWVLILWMCLFTVCKNQALLLMVCVLYLHYALISFKN